MKRTIRTSTLEYVDKPVLPLLENDDVEIIVDDYTKLEIESKDEKLKDFLKTKDIDLYEIPNKDGKIDKLKIKVGQYVGSAEFSNFVIQVSPKFSNIESLGQLIDYAYEFKDDDFPDNTIKFKEGQNQPFEYIVQSFVYSTQKLVKRGFYRSYVVIEEDIPYLKGKLLLKQQILNDLKFNLRFSCEHDEFTANNLENQIVLYTLKFCYRNTRIGNRKIQIQRLIHQMDYDVNVPTYLSVDEFNKISYTRLNQYYEKVHQLCKLLLVHSGVLNLKEQKTEFIFPFFVEMWDVFQCFISILFKEFYQLYSESDPKTSTYAWKIDGIKHTIKPDIITYLDKKSKVVHSILDVKYMKEIETGSKEQYQIAFYLNDYKKRIAYAILPEDKKSKPVDHIALNQDLEIRVRHIPIDDVLTRIYGKKRKEDKDWIEDLLLSKFPLLV